MYGMPAVDLRGKTADDLSQAITEVTRRLRGGNATNSLILANGGYLSYQHAVCLSKQPRKHSPYPDSAVLDSQPSEPIPPIQGEAEGKAHIEVEYHPLQSSDMVAHWNSDVYGGV